MRGNGAEPDSRNSRTRRCRRTAKQERTASLWKRRDQAARVVELYQMIDGESSAFERLFARLFAPYTA